MRRREFLSFCVGVVALSGRAQARQGAPVYRLAIVHPSSPASAMHRDGHPFWVAIFRELDRLGFVEGRNLIVERYTALSHDERLPEVARQAVQSSPAVIFGVSGRVLLELKRLTQTVPIVGMSSDPIAYGLVASLSHPAGNLTGTIVDAGIEIWGKRLQILKEVVPTMSRVFLVAPRSAWESALGAGIRQAARQFGVAIIGPPIESPHQEAEYRRAFAEAADAHGCIVSSSPENFGAQTSIIALTEERRLPTIFPYREQAAKGGLLSYDVDLPDLCAHSAQMIASILNGAHPGEIPFYQTTKFHLIVNLRTATAIGVSIPRPVLAAADEVVE